MTRDIDLGRWDRAFSAPARYAITVALAKVDIINFTQLRRALGISATLMSKHVSVLEELGYLRVEKVVRGRRVETEIHATEAGREALDQHQQLLEDLAAFGADRAGDVDD